MEVSGKLYAPIALPLKNNPGTNLSRRRLSGTYKQSEGVRKAGKLSFLESRALKSDDKLFRQVYSQPDHSQAEHLNGQMENHSFPER